MKNIALLFMLLIPTLTYSCDDESAFAGDTYLYAVMSANSYIKEENEPWVLPNYIKEVKNTEISCDICKPRKHEIETGVYNMKKGAQAKVFEIRNSDNVLKQVVIAYRGSQAWYDWIFGNLEKKQRKKAVSFYDSVKKHYPAETKLIVAGHSLGGAMSLHVSSERGPDAYVFNSSYRVKNKNPHKAKRMLVEEKGDPLAIHRYLWKNPDDVEKHKVDCTENDNHSIVKLSGSLLKMASAVSETAQQICGLTTFFKCK